MASELPSERASDRNGGASAAPPRARAGRALLPLAAVLLLGCWPLFRDLGGPALWEDEGDTAVFARNIVRSGLPVAWDGRTFADSDYGRRVAPRVFGADLVMVGTPWLSYYATAASFALLGESAWSARLPSALAALGAVALLYTVLRRATGDARAALAAAILLLLSTQFLLYARECRHYGLNMLLTVAVLGAFLRLRERPRDPWLVVAAVALFHTQILPAATALGACAAVTLVHPAFRGVRRAFWLRLPLVALGTAPWFWVAWQATGANWDPIRDAGELPSRVGQLALESSVAIPFLGWAVGIPLLWRRFGTRDRAWLALAGAAIAAVFALLPLALPAPLQLVVGLRYVCGLLPIAASVTGLLVARASGRSRLAFAALLLLFGATHLPGSALPWLWLGESRRVPGTRLFANVPLPLEAKLLQTTWWDFVRSLGRRDPGTASEIAAFLRAHAAPGDVVVTNYSWDNLYFQTDLAQGLRLPRAAPEPVRAAARAAGLPPYVFGLDGVDWVVWRAAAEPIPDWPLERVLAALAARGARAERVAAFRETLWENRPELHWHRFAAGGHPFAPARFGPRGATHPDALVFRIHGR